MSTNLPNLTFPMKKYSDLHVPHDLQVFLYVGASALKEREVHRRLSAGGLNKLEIGRLEVVEGLHDFLMAVTTGGHSDRTFNAHYKCLKVFFSYVDENGHELNIQSLERIFIIWANDISQQLQRGQISIHTAKFWTSKVGKSLEDILNMNTRTLLLRTRLGRTKGKNADFSVSAKHKTFEETRDFVSDLLDLINILSRDEAMMTLPLRLTTELSNKTVFHYGGNGRNFTEDKDTDIVVKPRTVLGNLQSDRAFMNLRLFCELHYFIFYTGANLADTTELEMASVQGWVEDSGRRFRTYKNRKGGEVRYKIYEKFVDHYSLYLEFRDLVVKRRPSALLFPFLKNDNENQSNEFQASQLRLLLGRLGRPYISPKAIRSYLLNDVFDFTGSVTVASGAGQHTTNTFIRHYMRPNVEVAAREWTKFYATVQDTLSSVAPGRCSSLQPIKIAVLEQVGAEPNCTNSAGCLFCEQYRGVISFDYIWSLLSYRKVKDSEGFIEHANGNDGALSTVRSVLFRIDHIIDEFRSQGASAENFYQDALTLCISDDHHPAWAGHLELMGLI
ncbi:hypothetical protein AB4P93_24750 [Pseudomonas sp. B26140]|uniref:hypothetical protein n=1 Tax=Pseudomonas sp. B26140 TaxID=3235112 RepID=UPI0037848FE8